MSQTATVSIANLFRRFRWRISLTFLLVIVDSALGVLYPLFIGLAIDGLLKSDISGLTSLALLGFASILVGSFRRFYDTRVYSSIYEQVAVELVQREQDKNSSISKTSARTQLLTEFVDFFEDSMPELLGAIISLIGILLIVAGLNLAVFLACIALLLLVVVVYTVTAPRNLALNRGYNDQFEQTVDVISSKRLPVLQSHFKRLMQWNIKLSDLETINFFVFWVGAVAVFVFTPYVVIAGGVVEYGLVLALLLYVFEFIDWLADLPLHIQQAIRLREISGRLQT